MEDTHGSESFRQSSSTSPSKQKSNISRLLDDLRIAPVSLSRVPRSSNILLLTPYVSQPPSNSNSTVSMDPFEPFGRSLSEHHPAIRHMPYVPHRGMIEVHRQFLPQAGAVIVVVSAFGLSQHESLQNQESFAVTTAELSKPLGIQSLLVVIGTNFDGNGKFDRCIKCRDWKQLESLGPVVFGE